MPTIAVGKSLSSVAKLYTAGGTFRGSLGTPTASVSWSFELNSAGSAITLEFPSSAPNGITPVSGDILKLVEQGGDGLVVWTGVIDKPNSERSGSSKYSFEVNPIGIELAREAFVHVYSVATDPGTIARDVVATCPHLTWDAASIPLVGSTTIINTFNGDSISALSDLRRMTGVNYGFWINEVGKVFFKAINLGAVPTWTIIVPRDATYRKRSLDGSTARTKLKVTGATPANATAPLSAVYDNSGGSQFGLRELKPDIAFPGCADQTTLQTIANTLGATFDHLLDVVDFELPGYGSRLMPGDTIRYQEPAKNAQPGPEPEVGPGTYSPNYVVTKVDVSGPLQRVTGADSPSSISDLQYFFEQMTSHVVTQGVNPLPITPGQVIGATTGGPNTPSTPAWVFGQWSTGIELLAQTNNAYVIVKWTPSPTNENVVRYEIRYSNNADGNYFFASVVGGVLDGGGRGFTKIAGLAPGTSYTFELRAINNLGIPSAWNSTQAQVTLADLGAPATPTGLVAATTPRGAIVTWDPNSEADMQGYGVQVSIGGGAYVDVAGGASASAIVFSTIMTYVAPAGTPAGTSLQFQVQAIDWSGNVSAFCTPSTSIATDAITNVDILAEAVTADKMAANSVTAQKLEAILLLISMIKIGSGTQHIELDSAGLRAYDSTGVQIINIPDDGSPVTINAQLIAQSLIATGNAVFQGTGNELARGASLQLDASQTNPTQAPILSAGFDGVTLPIDATYDTDATHYTRNGLDYDAVGGAGGATKVFWMTSIHSGLPLGLELLASTRAINRSIPLSSDGVGTALSLCRLGSFIYCLSKDGGTGSPTNFGHTGAATTGYDIASGASDNQIRSSSSYATALAGSITSLSVYMGGTGGVAVNAKLCIWNSSGTLVGQTATFSAASGRALHTKSLVTPVACTAGATFFIGFWRDPAGSAEWGVAASGTFRAKASGSAPSSTSGDVACGGAYFCGDMQAYGSYTPNTTTYKVRRYSQSTLIIDTTYSAVSFPVTATTPVMCQDGTNLYIVDKTNTGAIAWNLYDASMVKVGATISTTYGYTGSIYSAAAGSFDLGAARVIVGTISTFGFQSFNATGTNQANEAFPFVGTNAKGLAYGDALADGARFWSLPVTGAGAVNLTKHSLWVWTTVSSIYWVCYSWYDSNASGGTHETQIGPRGSITMGRRQQLTMTSPTIAGAGGVDDPDSVRFYMLPNATDPGATALKLQATQAAITYLATTYASGGAADPASNNFPGGGPASMKSQVTTPGWSLSGDGSATGFGQLIDTQSPSGVASFDFVFPLPTRFDHLVIIWQARETGVVSTDFLKLRFNTDSAANYYRERAGWNGASIAAAELLAQTAAEAGELTGASVADAGLAAMGQIFIPNFGGSTFKKQWGAMSFLAAALTTTLLQGFVPSGVWNSTAAITRITVLAGTGNFVAGSKFSLYGF